MKKFLAVLSVLLVAVMMLTACSGGTGAKKASSNSEYAGMGDGKTLTYWCEWNESETQWDVYKETIARFEADTGYTVNVEHYGRDVAQLYPAAIDAGQEFDIFDMNGTKPKEGYCVDIDALMEKYNVKKNVLAAYATYEETVSPFGDGKWYGVPSQPFFGAVFYNKDIFDEVGIKELPTTWNEFLDCCKKIKDGGYAPITIDDAYADLLWTYQLALGLGGQAELEKLASNFGADWEKALPVLEKFEELRTLGYFQDGVGGYQFPAAQNGEFAMGTAAMYGFDGSWVCNEVHDITGDDFNWGVMFWPSMTTDDYKYLELSCQQICVSPTSKDVEGAALLLKYMIDAETCTALRDQCQCIPVVEGVDWPEALKGGQELAGQAEGTFMWNVLENSDPDVTTMMKDSFYKLIGGLCTAQDVVDVMVSGKAA